MKRWKKTRRKRRRRDARKVPQYYRLGVQIQKLLQHAKAQARREKRQLARMQGWAEDGERTAEQAAQHAQTIFGDMKRDGWRVGKSGWWRPSSTVRRAIAKVV